MATNGQIDKKPEKEEISHYYEENDIDTYFSQNKIKIPDDEKVI